MKTKLQIEHNKIWQLVKKAQYKKALQNAKTLIQKHPNELSIQITYATILGDASECFSGIKKIRMKNESVDFMKSLLRKNKRQKDFAQISRLKNEYFWQTSQHLKQYKLGSEKLNKGFKASGYYSQGVGAAWHAYKLALRGHRLRSAKWAKSSIQAWKKFAKLQSYYNQFVHMALAYGVLGDLKNMEKSLFHGAKLCGKNKNYPEFQKIRELVEKLL